MKLEKIRVNLRDVYNIFKFFISNKIVKNNFISLNVDGNVMKNNVVVVVNCFVDYFVNVVLNIGG